MHYPTLNDILNHLFLVHEVEILPDTLRKWIYREKDIKIVEATPLEEARMKVSFDDISSYFDNLEKIISNYPSAFVYNVDESGFDKFADKKNCSIVVPNNINNTNWFHCVSRNEKRTTLIACVSADGGYVKPMVVARESIDMELFELGFTPDRVAYTRSSTGYITTEIFEEWITKVFIPHINCLKLQYDRLDQRALLLMDGCSCHSSENIDEILFSNGIDTFQFVPHSSDQVQQLDIGIFGNLKGAQSRIHPCKVLSTQSKQLIKMLCAYQAVCHPMSITGAFRRSGIISRWKEGLLWPEIFRPSANAIRNIPQDLPS